MCEGMEVRAWNTGAAVLKPCAYALLKAGLELLSSGSLLVQILQPFSKVFCRNM